MGVPLKNKSKEEQQVWNRKTVLLKERQFPFMAYYTYSDQEVDSARC